MSFKTKILIICKALKAFVSLYSFYKKLTSETDRKFIVYCQKAEKHAKTKLKIKDIRSECIGDFCYIKGTYPDGSPYKQKIQRGKQ